MINYLPERIYQYLKNDATYLEIVKMIEEGKANCKSLKEYNDLDTLDYHGEDKVNRVEEKLEAVIDKLCPQYKIDYQVTRGIYTTGELLSFYGNTADYESRFILLSAIIDRSYINLEYTKYMEIYNKLYEAMSLEEKLKLTQYPHMKYMKNKIYLKSLAFEFNTVLELLAWIKEFYIDIKSYEANSDTLTNSLIECLCTTINNLQSIGIKDADVLEFASGAYQWANSLQFQYREYSFGRAALLENMARINASLRDITEFVNANLELAAYVDNALSNIQECCKGLYYYDKRNGVMMISIVRWILKLQSIPLFGNNGLCVLKNLTKEDHDFAISDMEEVNSRLIGKNNHTGSTMYSKDIDKWFSDSNSFYIDILKI